jgi:hypothetical protein
MLCPLEALGVLPQDGCCASFSVAQDDPSSTPKSGCSYEVKFRLSNGCTGCAAQEFRAEAKEEFFVSAQHSMASSWELSKPDVDFSQLPRGWQFQWRTALAPRAPSFLA